jgi:YD repeat-containing protein
VKEIQASGATIDRTYDHAGNVIQIDNHVDLPTSYGYDSAGRQTSTTQGSHQTSGLRPGSWTRLWLIMPRWAA